MPTTNQQVVSKESVRRAIRRLAGEPPREVCALCGKRTVAFRTVCKRSGHLQEGYYRPRLTEDELYLLKSGESAVCTNRAYCRQRRLFYMIKRQRANRISLNSLNTSVYLRHHLQTENRPRRVLALRGIPPRQEAKLDDGNWWPVDQLMTAGEWAIFHNNHDVLEDLTSSGYERLTCRTCEAQIIRTSWMSRDYWLERKAGFINRHRPNQLPKE